MGKSQKAKLEKVLRSIRREVSDPLLDKKEAAKLAAQQPSSSAPNKLSVPNKPSIRFQSTTAGAGDNAMEITYPTNNTNFNTDVDMAEGGSGNTNGQSSRALKPVGGVGKKMKKKLKIGKKGKRWGKKGGKNKY